MLKNGVNWAREETCFHESIEKGTRRIDRTDREGTEGQTNEKRKGIREILAWLWGKKKRLITRRVIRSSVGIIHPWEMQSGCLKTGHKLQKGEEVGPELGKNNYLMKNLSCKEEKRAVEKTDQEKKRPYNGKLFSRIVNTVMFGREVSRESSDRSSRVRGEKNPGVELTTTGGIAGRIRGIGFKWTREQARRDVKKEVVV